MIWLALGYQLTRGGLRLSVKPRVITHFDAPKIHLQ